ncbi:MAG: ABC transporter ATP-binding protein/permease [Lachnospiraceae bacterium]|nr:ABC transporter ATP-binding protein/permease [Lachnospiraceae bacterium]
MGEVLINDRPIEDYSKKELFKRAGVSLQSPDLYSFTLGENVNLGELEESKETLIMEALRNIGADSVIKKTHKKGETPMTKTFEKDGVELSGGEIQKVAIARALYKGADFLVLDEPSAALDPEAEDHFFSFLYNSPRDEMVLFTTHRMKNVKLADRVLVIENGRIVESGSANALIKQCGLFAKMCNGKGVTM